MEFFQFLSFFSFSSSSLSSSRVDFHSVFHLAVCQCRKRVQDRGVDVDEQEISREKSIFPYGKEEREKEREREKRERERKRVRDA